MPSQKLLAERGTLHPPAAYKQHLQLQLQLFTIVPALLWRLLCPLSSMCILPQPNLL